MSVPVDPRPEPRRHGIRHRFGAAVTALLLVAVGALAAVQGAAPAHAAPPSQASWAQAVPTQLPPVEFDPLMAYDPVIGKLVLFDTDDGSTWGGNGNSWTPLPSGPTPETGATMVYDAATQQIVLFGGRGNGSDNNETWTFDGTNWTRVAVSGAASPPGRYFASMAYDADDEQKIVLFGGIDNDNDLLPDTWTFSNDTWTQLLTNPAPSPPADGGAAMTYDSDLNQVIYFDGYTRDTWTSSALDGGWGQYYLSPSGPATGIGVTAMAYDPATREVALVGDEGEAWTMSNTGWVQIPTAPSPRASAATTYAPDIGRVVLFGGFDTQNDNLNDTWTFDSSTGAWTRLSPNSSPPGRGGASMVYDPSIGRIILFGGSPTGTSVLGDTWSFDPSTGQWTQLFPATSPPPRYAASMAYDAKTGEVVLFGGLGDGADLGDTWTFNGTNWTRLSPASSPSARDGAAAAYDPDTGRIVLFGGEDSWERADTWAFDGSTWTELAPASSPTAQVGAAMDYDPAAGQLILVSFDRGTTWAFDGTTWAQLSPASSPPPRYDASLTYDAGANRLVLFGGISGANDDDDTWLFSSAPPLASPALSLTASPASGQTRPGDVTLTATLSGFAGTVQGEPVTFTVDGANSGTAALGASGTATFTVPAPAAGDYTFGASFAGDAGNAAASATPISGYDVSLAQQAPLQIEDPGALTFGDADFTLTATGGSGNGALSWSVPTDNGVLSVAADGAAQIIGTGTVTVTAVKAGDGVYDQASATAQVRVTTPAVVQNTIDLIGALPSTVATAADADRVAAATVADEALSPAQQALLPASATQALDAAQSQAAAINHADSLVGVTASGPQLPWNVRLTVTHVGASDARWSSFARALPSDRALLALDDITFIDTLTGNAWEPAPGEAVTVTLSGLPTSGHSGIALVHQGADGVQETVADTIAGRTLTFQGTSFSLYGVTANAPAAAAATPGARASGASRAGTGAAALAATGTDTWPGELGGMALALAGLALVATAARRRRRTR